MINDEYIINKYWKNKSISFFRFYNSNKVSDDELLYLNNRYSDSDSLLETLYRIKHNIDTKPICPICGKIIPFNIKSKSFNQFCSRQCANKNPKLLETRKKTYFEKFGSSCPSKSQKVKEKIHNTWQSKTDKDKNEIIRKTKQTKLERYGDENFVNTEKIKQTKHERYGNENFVNAEKTKQTKHERYGDENFVNTEKTKQTKLKRYGDENYCNVEKIKQTKLERYGDENFVNTEKIKQTNIERYGYEYGLSNKIVREKIKQTNIERYGVETLLLLDNYRDKTKHISHESRLKAKETSLKHFGKDNYNNREQYKQTCLDKYNVIHYSSTDEYKANQSVVMSLPETQQKRYNTMKKNNSFNISNPENEAYNLIKRKYNDVIRQYKSDLYPFACDFYIPSKDIYIECHFHWTHGGRPFDKTNDNDKNMLKIWEHKNTKFYQNAIYTWTCLDVKKRETAKNNNLNFFEFYTILELINWLNKCYD